MRNLFNAKLSKRIQLHAPDTYHHGDEVVLVV